ncbi:MAG TPA: YciI family protein [Stellaceae bacterium]|nr:YciI family protein [Stellaceae bacterium]
MKYMLMIYGNEAAMAAARQADMQQLLGAYSAYTEALKKAGAFIAGDALERSATATTVRIANGKSQVLNGPYAETKEQLAGYYLIDAPDLDAALAWAARCPGASHGVMEVRPLRAM